MSYCPVCEQEYGDGVGFCTLDGAALVQSLDREEPSIGRVIKGKYRVIKKLGQGGMAAVYLCEQMVLGRKVALKVLHGAYGRDPEFVQRFHHEARLVASLNHRNIVTVYDFDQAEDGSPLIAMEYLEGSDLGNVIREGPMDVEQALRVAIQIGEGLAAAHRAGVIHRDIKPENIMLVGHDQEVKLMDFGIARLREMSGMAPLTRQGMIMGTPAYMAPEQIEGTDITEKTDIYAYGIVLYQMLTGDVPFRASTPSALLMKHLQEKPVPVRKLRSDVPVAVERVVMQALEKNPVRRQSNVQEVVGHLRQLVGQTAALEIPEAARRRWWPWRWTYKHKVFSVEELRRDIQSTVERVVKETLARDLELRTRAMQEGVTVLKSNPSSIGILQDRSPPSGFFSDIPMKTAFFTEGRARYEAIQETLKFYRDHLEKEYKTLARQADLTYLLWIFCVGLGFLVLIAALILLLYGRITQGILTSVSTVLVYFIQRVFQNREDHYRSLAGAKNRHLEYGNQWLLVIQSIDAIEDQGERVRRQARLVDALTKHLRDVHVDVTSRKG